MRPLRTVAVSLVATVTVAAPLAAVTTAGAEGRDRPVIKVRKEAWLSPNGDRSQDKARLRFTVAKKSEVIVKVRRGNKARTVVYEEKLGKVSRGGHTWTWKGENLNGKVVRDGRYTAVLVADQVAEGAEKGRTSSVVHVDTHFDADWAPKLNADTVYPTTTVIRDRIGLTLGNYPDDPMTTLGQVVSTMKDAEGRVVSTGRPFEYHTSPYTDVLPILISGRDRSDQPYPAGSYRLRFKVWDKAGNPGGSKAVTLHVSDRPLVEASGSVLAPPTGSWKASQLPAGAPAGTAPSAVRDGRASTTGGDDPQPVPCGTVVSSEVYADAGAMSFRSSDACGGTWGRPSLAAAGGGLALDTLTPQVAPRGLRTSWLSMRGKPTVAGETDTARLYSRALSYFFDTGGPYVSSPAVAAETVTNAEPVSYPWEPVYSDAYTRRVDWSIATLGTDSYDVAAVTVHYTYLTPQAS